MVVSPYQTKHFANAMNILCKTDRVDARILSAFTEKMDFKKTILPSVVEMQIQELSKHLDDLQKLKQEQEQRVLMSCDFIAESIQATVSVIKVEMKKTETHLNKLISSEVTLDNRCRLLESIPGIGRSSAVMLLSYLRELGEVKKTEIAAIAGVAPMNRDSGIMIGKKRIKHLC